MDIGGVFKYGVMKFDAIVLGKINMGQFVSV